MIAALIFFGIVATCAIGGTLYIALFLEKEED